VGIFLLFLLALAAGSLSTLFWIPEEDLGRGYFQMNALVVLGLVGLAAAVVVLGSPAPFAPRVDLGRGTLLAGLAAAFAYYAGVWRRRWAWARGAAALALVATGSALWLAGSGQIAPLTALPHQPTLVAATLLTSSVVLGWSLVTMLLGHWYLVAPRLTFRHLTVFCWVLLVAVLARCAVVAATLSLAAAVDPRVEPNPWRLITGFEGQGMFFWFRLLWGLGIPVALAWMALHCARRRSNQSATGILYVLVVGVLVGEITAFYVSVTTGVPI
jgi:hypothetical protein